MKLKANYITKTKENRLHLCPIPVIGLTGGIATGKTTASTILSDMGFTIICADKLIKEIYQKSETFDFVRSEFSDSIINNQIDFKVLRKMAFAQEKNREKLEQFLYAHLPAQFNSSYDPNDQVIIYDVPLLYEKNLDQLVDYSLLIYAPEETQIERLVQRDQINLDLAKNILKNQLPIEEKRVKANYIIENTADTQALDSGLKEWVSSIFE